MGRSLSQTSQSPHLSFSIFWWLLDLRADVLVCWGICLLPPCRGIALRQLEALALEVVCLVARHPQPTLPVSIEKISAKTKSDLVTVLLGAVIMYVGVNIANMCCCFWMSWSSLNSSTVLSH